MIYVVHAPATTNKRNTSFIMGRVVKFAQFFIAMIYFLMRSFYHHMVTESGLNLEASVLQLLNAVLIKLLSLGGLQLN